MKKPLSILAFCLLTITAFAQEAYEKQLKTLADQLAQKIKPTNKKRVAVASFVDLQGNITELGKALAEEYGVYLSDNQLEVVDRGQVDKLLKENELPQTGLLDSKQASALGKVSGIQIIITGTVTPLDNSVRMILKAIDLEKAVQIGGSIGSIQRTGSIDALIRTVVSSPDESRRGESQDDKTPSPTAQSKTGEYEKDLPSKQCTSGGYTFASFSFENLFNEAILLYQYKRGGYTSLNSPESVNILIAPGSEGYTPLINLEGYPFASYTFFFRTVGANVREGFLTLTINGCKEKHISLTPKNFHLSKPKEK
jgi:TolB-like protein